ncbi:MAG TPA: hypothetical protein VK973_12165 [Arenicellales bacterium]|nr:hypothetical protein [Arenicellales bacterium]
MDVEGISVAEIRLGLPNTHYCLFWETGSAPPRPADRRALTASARETARRFGWQVLAAGVDDEHVARLLFETTADNLERGMSALLHGARDYRVYMVQPEAAVPLATRFICDTRHDRGAQGKAAGPVGLAALPEIHYGLFMGDRRWAERMLTLLIRGARGEPAGSRGPASLAELSASHDSTRDAIVDAYRCGRFSLKDIAEHFGMHFSEVSAVLNAIHRQPQPAREWEQP